MGYPARNELTRGGLLVYLANYYVNQVTQNVYWAFSLDETQGHINRTHNESRTYPFRFATLAY